MAVESLKDLDPDIFGEIIPGDIGAKPRGDVNNLSELDSDIFAADNAPKGGGGYLPQQVLPAALGAAAGEGVKWATPGVPEPKSKVPDSLQVREQVARQALERRVQDLQSAQRAHGINVDSAFAGHSAAQARLGDTRAALDEARAAVPALTPASESLRLSEEPRATGRGAAVQNYASTVTPDITSLEARQGGDYAGAWDKTRNAQSVADKTRGFIPGRNLMIPITMAGEEQAALEAHQRAQAGVARAESAHAESVKAAAAAQQRFEGLRASTPAPVSKAQTAVRGGNEAVAKLTDQIAILEAKNPGLIAKLGFGISKIPLIGALAGGLTVAEIHEAIQQAQKKNYADAAMSGMSGVGGALMFIPHPATQVAGAAISAAPLAYHAVNSARYSHAKLMEEAPPQARGLMFMP